MSSILTNNSAMVALQTLKQINMNLAGTQNEISTGKSVADAKDNSAVWAISKVMSSDVQGFEAISDSLSLGESTVAVAQNASETVTDLLTEIKAKIVNAQEDNVDRAKIQEDVVALRDQITSVINAAQFNGQNLINGTSESIDVLSSLDRDANGGVTSSNINVTADDLTSTASVLDTGGTYAGGTGGATATLNATQTNTITIASVTAGVGYSLGLTGTDADASSFTPGDVTTAASVAGASEMFYIAQDGDTVADVVSALATQFGLYAGENGVSEDVLTVTANGNNLTVTSTVTSGTDTIAVRIDTATASAGNENTVGGGLENLARIDVSTAAGAAGALSAIEGLTQTAIDAAASFGSSRGRIETQSDFISKLTDSLKSGIGALVDADMEAASARLQALQTQQQLAVQALSIANQSPQTILSLFR